MAKTTAPAGRPLMTQVVLVAASLVCGAGIWLVVQLTQTQEVTLSIQVRPANVAPEVILRVRPEEVPVRFSYPGTEQGRMQPDNFYVEVDFSDLTERIGKRLEDSGDQVLSRDMVRMAFPGDGFNIQVVDLLSPQVRWEARLRSARGIIRPTITGEPAAGFTVDPEQAVVDGQREIIVLLTPEKEADLEARGEDTVTISTEPLDVSGRRGIVRDTVNLQLPEGVSLLPGESIENRTVVVEIVEQTITRVIENIPIQYEFLFSGEGLEAIIEPPTVDVSVTGRASAVNSLRPAMINFGLFGVSERAGERREVAIETRIVDPGLRAQILDIESQPRTVTVTIRAREDAEPPPEEPQEAPEPETQNADEPTT